MCPAYPDSESRLWHLTRCHKPFFRSTMLLVSDVLSRTLRLRASNPTLSHVRVLLIVENNFFSRNSISLLKNRFLHSSERCEETMSNDNIGMILIRSLLFASKRSSARTLTAIQRAISRGQASTSFGPPALYLSERSLRNILNNLLFGVSSLSRF